MVRNVRSESWEEWAEGVSRPDNKAKNGLKRRGSDRPQHLESQAGHRPCFFLNRTPTATTADPNHAILRDVPGAGRHRPINHDARTARQIAGSERPALANGTLVCFGNSLLDRSGVNAPNGLPESFRGGVSEPRQHRLEAGVRDREQIRTPRARGTEQKSGDGLPLRSALIFLREPENDFTRVGESVDCSAVLKKDRPR